MFCEHFFHSLRSLVCVCVCARGRACFFVVAKASFLSDFSVPNSLDVCCPPKTTATFYWRTARCTVHAGLKPPHRRHSTLLHNFCTRERDNIIILNDKVVLARGERACIHQTIAARCVIYFLKKIQVAPSRSSGGCEVSILYLEPSLLLRSPTA